MDAADLDGPGARRRQRDQGRFAAASSARRLRASEARSRGETLAIWPVPPRSTPRAIEASACGDAMPATS